VRSPSQLALPRAALRCPITAWCLGPVTVVDGKGRSVTTAWKSRNFAGVHNGEPHKITGHNDGIQVCSDRN